MMPNIRRARLQDATALAGLKLRTFRETFVEGDIEMGYTPENLALFEAESYSEPVVAAQLVDPRRGQWVAVAPDGRFAGYAHAGPCKLPHPEADATQGELYQIYIAREWQGSGLGRALLDTAFGWLGQVMPGPIWLGVFSGNYRAQAVYAARGFTKVGEYAFKVGDQRDHEYIFRRN